MAEYLRKGVLLLALVLCVGIPPVRGAEVPGVAREAGAEAVALQEGIDLYVAGQTQAALSLLQSFVTGNPQSKELPTAFLYLGRIARDRGRPDEALSYLERIPGDRQNERVRLERGAALVEVGRAREGLALLQPLEEDALSPWERGRRFSAMADAQAVLGRPLVALVLLHAGMANAGAEERDSLWRRGHRLLAERLGEVELTEAAFMLRGTPLGEDASLQLARKAASRGARDQALGLVQTLLLRGTNFPSRAEAVKLYDQLAERPWLQRALGVVLPLSGRYATYGDLVRRGMDLALEMHKTSAPPVRLVYRDIGADPARSVAAVTELADSERVMAVLGPLTGTAAAAAAVQAQAERLPMLSLSQREGLPETGEFVFRNSLTSRLQARALARYAVLERGFTGFGILYPENLLGQEMAHLFAEEVRKLGGLVVISEGYAETATDFGRQIKRLMGMNPDAPAEINAVEAEKRKNSSGREFPPVNFDALFIPDYADRIGMVAPQLAYYGIEGVPLLGINGWNSPELVRLAGRSVEGSVFVDGFFRYSPYPFVREFVDRYFEKYGEEPSILEAQGYDAVGILLTILDRRDIRTRDDLRLALSMLQNYPGITGATTFDFQGDADKVLFLLQVENGNIVQIN
jgi:ABC-type branched-subunit amino acid transport system substrate-binding protein